MILPSNGMTIPNKLKIMAWISETSTVAGTLALAIPAFASLMMQFVAPKLALALGALTMGVGGMASTAQRAGMNALPQAEKTAMELERDKINKMFLEAGDVEQQRRGQMNALADARHNNNFGRVSGESPMQHGAPGTNVGQGYTFKGTSSGAEDTTLSAQESAARASVSQSVASSAYSGLTQASTADQQRIAQSISDSHTKTGNVQAMKAESAAMSAAEEVGRSKGVDATKIANAQSALKMGMSAGLEAKGLEIFVAKAMASGEGSVSTQDSKKHSDVASEMVKHAFGSQDVQSY